MMLLIWIIILIAGLFLLIKSADYFTDSAEKIGLYFGMPAFLAGVTIVAVGTSVPELATSIIAVLKNSSEIVLGNVVGSNIANILLILGIVAVINKKVTFEKSSKIDLILLIFATLLLVLFSLDGAITPYESVAFLSIYIFYIIIIFINNKDNKRPDIKWSWKHPLILVVSCGVIYISAEYIIKSVIIISETIGIGKEVIAASAVAFGTSLPELSVSFIAARKGNIELSIGNILGSNVFNTLVVLGIPGLISTLTVTGVMLSFTIPVMIMATIILVYVIKTQRLESWQGIIMLAMYALFIIRLFNVF